MCSMSRVLDVIAKVQLEWPWLAGESNCPAPVVRSASTDVSQVLFGYSDANQLDVILCLIHSDFRRVRDDQLPSLYFPRAVELPSGGILIWLMSLPLLALLLFGRRKHRACNRPMWSAGSQLDSSAAEQYAALAASVRSHLQEAETCNPSLFLETLVPDLQQVAL